MKSDVVDIAGVLHAETAAAILFSDTAHREDAKWLPKSQIEIEHDGGRRNYVTVTMPERLAVEKGFVWMPPRAPRYKRRSDDTINFDACLSLPSWQPFSSAPTDGTPILAQLADIQDERFKHWSGRYFVVSHAGFTPRNALDLGWNLFPGFGCSAEWFLRWMPIPKDPRTPPR